MKRLLLAASTAAVISLSALPGTAAACDPGMPTCGSGTVVENVERWANARLYYVREALEHIDWYCTTVCLEP